MYLTQYTDYALRVLIYTAANQDKLVNIGSIAEAYGISKSHLMKVVTALVKAGFLEGVRGKGGGLRLGKPAEEICIGEVVRELEPFPIVECMGSNGNCILTPSCRFAGVLNGALQQFLHYLDGYTLADLMNQPLRDKLIEPPK